ncbi:protein of unknown function [Geodermatophilus saharensis]|uniref:eCIS core domain-containing protein n=1 Tax=Geodermatophilus saharensis TaxID=1137994 RepID=A0A239C4Z6_9ACTN|nr:DUF4157 domain-containing protein [Geodermatophilus saharensis]SNS15266.1 protein of unknown function [Geodermatophilus saharensis]
MAHDELDGDRLEDRPPTLGELLDARARRAAVRLLPALPWAAPLRVLHAHLAALAPPNGRFDRIEVRPGQALPRPEHPGRHVPAPPAPGPAPAPPAHDGAAPEGRPLPPDVRGRLGDVLADGPTANGGAGAVRGEVGRAAAGALRVHDDEAADRLARAHRADAVTVGRDVAFRRGRYRPRDDAGFALLVHEATHVLALLEPGAAWQRATSGGRRDEEARAQEGERAGLAAARLPAVTPRTGRPAPPPTTPNPAAYPGPAPHLAHAAHPAPAAPPAAHPMTAVQGRDVAPASAAAPDLAALRNGLIEELMRRLRTEFERGA